MVGGIKTEVNIVALHVVLYQPEIPANTGNIARTCAATDTTLHLIRPLGFSTDDKMLKRAGLDYWEFVNVVYHDSLEELFEAYENGKFSSLQNSAKSRTHHLITQIRRKTFSSYSAEKRADFRKN